MGRRCGAVFHKVVREGLYEKTLKLGPEYKNREPDLGRQAKGRDSAKVLRYGWNRIRGRKNSRR